MEQIKRQKAEKAAEPKTGQSYNVLTRCLVYSYYNNYIKLNLLSN